MPVSFRQFIAQFIVGGDELNVQIERVLSAQRKLRGLIRATHDEIEGNLMSVQNQLDALTDQVTQGVQELRDEIQRQAGLPPEEVDFTRLQGLADALASDNVPAAPPVEEPPAEPAPPVEPPVEEVPAETPVDAAPVAEDPEGNPAA